MQETISSQFIEDLLIIGHLRMLINVIKKGTYSFSVICVVMCVSRWSEEVIIHHCAAFNVLCTARNREFMQCVKMNRDDRTVLIIYSSVFNFHLTPDIAVSYYYLVPVGD